MKIYHFYLIDNSIAMNEMHSGDDTYMDYYKSNVSLIISNDKFSQNFSIYLFSDGLKARKEEFDNRKKLFNSVNSIRTGFEIASLDSIATVNSKIKALSDKIDENSKIILHYILSSDNQELKVPEETVGSS